jgi:hypothetical protein
MEAGDYVMAKDEIEFLLNESVEEFHKDLDEIDFYETTGKWLVSMDVRIKLLEKMIDEINDTLQ